jgi:multiple antibiotic resistance protein
MSIQPELLLQLCISLFAILDPIAVIPYYLATNPEWNQVAVKRDARIMAGSAFLILLIGGFLGLELLGFFGLDMRYFAIAWGIIIAYNGFRMVSWLAPAWHKELGTKLDDIDWRWLIVPLTMPLVSGPGSLAFVISRFGSGQEVWWSLTIAIIVCCLLYYIIIRFSPYLQKLFWHLWIALISRFMGLILLGIGIQSILSNL